MGLGEWINAALGKTKAKEENRVVHIGESELNVGFSGNFVSTTRYTLLTFIPKNLWEQFGRLANVYFLIVALLQVFTDLSPTGKYTTIGPLMLILSISAIKDAIEDFILNSEGQWEERPWKDLKVGDLVKIHNKQFFPADIFLMSSSEPLGMTYIETSNLDGETNLKIRQALMETNEPLVQGNDAGGLSVASVAETGTEKEDIQALLEFRATLNCEPPNNRLHEFNGNLEYEGHTYSLSNQQLLLRGAQLRQTAWAIGCVVFSGYDTKVVRNSSKAPTKRSNIELRTNDFIIVILTLMGLLILSAATAATVWGDDEMDEAWYLPEGLGKTQAFVQTFATFLILLSTMVPISLYVTMEIVKMIQAFHINWDRDMYDEETGTFGLARSSGLNEELGQVEYIFSDKTGTLTQNLMEFRKCTVGAIKYGKGTTEIGRAAALRHGKSVDEDENSDWKKPDPMFNFRDERFTEHQQNDHPNAKLIDEFLVLLSVCHTVVPEGAGDSLVYQAASPDEAALVAAAKCFGYRFQNRSPKTVEVLIAGEEREYKVLNVLEFNSDRKRMSVIVKCPDGRVVLYCKGADTKIYERITPGQSHANITLQYLEEFASEGLRTLCCGYREIEESEWSAWNERFEKANTSLENRVEELNTVSEEIEKDLILLGTTAIEDKLQDGVPDCIATLARANIKIWVLTGDKQETAINIGFACALLTDEMVLLILNEADMEATRTAINARWDEYCKLDEQERKEVAIIIDGKTLEYILEDETMRMLFLELGKRSKAVVCCRVTPKQKADVTLLVKENDGRICLAIGDGANDVAMIQAAHVGIGISGKEGLQAVQSSDYAIAQFRFLKKLLLVHGHWNYRRVSRVITFNFYKNICLYMTQFWFSLYNLMSGASLYEAWTQSSFNVFFASLPIMAYGVLDQDVCVRGLYEFPMIYRIGQNKELFNAKMFAFWLVNAFWHSVVCFIVPVFIFLSQVSSDGQSRGLYSQGLYTYTAIVVVVSGKVLIMTRTHNWVSILCIVLSILAWFMWLLIYSFIIIEQDQLTAWQLGYAVLDLPSWWLATMLIVVMALSRDVLWRSYLDSFTDKLVAHANAINKYDKWDELALMREEEEKERLRRLSQRRSSGQSEERKSTNISTLRKCNSGLGFAMSFTERDPQHGSDFEQRLRQLLYSEKRRDRRSRRKSKTKMKEKSESNSSK